MMVFVGRIALVAQLIATYATVPLVIAGILVTFPLFGPYGFPPLLLAVALAVTLVQGRTRFLVLRSFEEDLARRAWGSVAPALSMFGPVTMTSDARIDHGGGSILESTRDFLLLRRCRVVSLKGGERWKPQVEKLLVEASFVVVDARYTGEGLRWEVRAAAERVAIGSLLVVVPDAASWVDLVEAVPNLEAHGPPLYLAPERVSGFTFTYLSNPMIFAVFRRLWARCGQEEAERVHG